MSGSAVTVGGGHGHAVMSAQQNSSGALLAQNRLLAASLGEQSSSAKYYATQGATTPPGGLSTAPASFGLVAIQNNGGGATVIGGTNPTTSYATVGAAASPFGGGSDTIQLGGLSSTLAQGASSVPGGTPAGGISPSFVATHSPNTVLGGNVTLYGADSVTSTTGGATHVAASLGNETLLGDQGPSSIGDALHPGKDALALAGDATISAMADVVHGFDLPHFGAPDAGDDLQAPGPKAGSLTLHDGTKIVVEGASHLTNTSHH